MAADLAPQPTAPLTPAAPPLAAGANPTAPDVETVHVTGTKPGPLDTGEMDEKYGEMQGKLAAVNESTGALQPPEMKAPPPPTPQQTNPLEGWGAAAMAFAAVGSLLTRQPLTTAMNAAAGAMNAIKKNDTEAANLAFDQWKAASDMVVKQQNFQMEAYKAALAKGSTDEKGAVAEFTAYAHAFGDKVAAERVQQEGVQGAARVVAEQEKATTDYYKNMGNIIQAKNFQDAQKDPAFVKSLEGKSPAEQAKLKMKLLQDVAPGLAGANGILSEDDIDMRADQALAGDPAAAQGLPYGKAGANSKILIANRMAEKAKADGMSGADLAARNAEFQGMKSGERTLATASARIGLGVAELKRLEPQVQDASTALKRGNYPSINALIQAGQRESGDPKLKDLAVRLQGLKSAFSQVLTRGGVPTDSARATTDELFSSKDPDRVLQSAMKAMNSEAGAIEAAPGDVQKQMRDRLKGTSGNLPAVSTQAQFDKLPKGAHYMEDGNEYIKP